MILQFTSKHFEFLAANQDHEYIVDLDTFRPLRRGVVVAVHVNTKRGRRTYSFATWRGFRRLDWNAA